jgi:hypothetical protein
VELAGLRADAAFAMEQVARSERRACRLVELDGSSYRYEPRADHNAELREELVKLARQKPRYGYPRLHVLRNCGTSGDWWTGSECAADLPIVPGGTAYGATSQRRTTAMALQPGVSGGLRLRCAERQLVS